MERELLTGKKIDNFIRRKSLVLNPLKSSGYYMYRTVVTICTAQFNIQQFYVLPTHAIYMFCVDLRTNSHYFPIQH